MSIILFFTILGFMCGLGYVMVKRKIKPGLVLAATFAAFLSTAIAKILKDYYRNKKRFY